MNIAFNLGKEGKNVSVAPNLSWCFCQIRDGGT
jgi:hypothetical protein